MKTECAIFLCDKSGVMARPWAEAGVICICIDIQHSIRATRKEKHTVERFTSGGEIHFMYGDARSWKPSSFDSAFFTRYKIIFVACFPVCTNLAGSGSQDWQLKGLAMLTDGLMLFNSCEQVADWSGAPYCVENPVGALTKHHRKPDYYFQPWEYGEMYQKKTCLWVGNGFAMPPVKCVEKHSDAKQKIWLETPSDERQDIRSETSQMFAEAVFEANYTSFQLKVVAQ